MTKNVTVKRVSKMNYQQAIEDKQVEGWNLKNSNDQVAIMTMSGGWGSAGAHILIFLFTWWSLGLINLAYALYIHSRDGGEMQIKVDEPGQAGQPAPV